MITITFVDNSNRDFEAAVVNLIDRTVFSPASGKFEDDPADGFTPMGRFKARGLEGVSTLTLAHPAVDDLAPSLAAVIRLAGTTTVVWEPIPLERYRRTEYAVTGGWLW